MVNINPRSKIYKILKFIKSGICKNRRELESYAEAEGISEPYLNLILHILNKQKLIVRKWEYDKIKKRKTRKYCVSGEVI